MINRKNYIQISAFMVLDLQLKGNELITYAIIYGFSQDGVSEFGGSLSYLCEWLGTSKPTVIKTLKALTDKGYIIKTERTVNRVKFNYYRANLDILENLDGGGKETLPVVKNLDGGGKETLLGGKETLLGVVKKFNQGGKETLPNNNNNNITDIKNNNKKHIYGEYRHVMLTDSEKQKLFSEYGEDETLKAITYLDEYIEMKGAKYKSHYLVMKKWVFDAVKEKASKNSKQEPPKTEFEYEIPDSFFAK